MDPETRRTSESVAATTADGAPSSQAPGLFARGVYRRLLEEGYRFQFSQVARLLERAAPAAPNATGLDGITEGPVRFRPSAELVFPPTDVKRVERTEEDPVQIEVVVAFLGLYGIDSPLPTHFHDHLAQGTEETAAHREFLDIFNHRLYAFFYQAWKKYRPDLHYRPHGRDLHSRRFVSLAGLGTPGALENVSLPPMQLAAQARVLASQTRNAAGLKALIEAFFGNLTVEVVENVPRWVDNPSRSGLGDSDFQLGKNATIGEAVYDRSGKFRLRFEPMSLEQYLALLPGGDDVPKLQTLVRLAAPDYLDYDVELQIRTEKLPRTELGGSGTRLGFTASAGTPEGPLVRRTVEYDADASA